MKKHIAKLFCTICILSSGCERAEREPGEDQPEDTEEAVQAVVSCEPGYTKVGFAANINPSLYPDGSLRKQPVEVLADGQLIQTVWVKYQSSGSAFHSFCVLGDLDLTTVVLSVSEWNVDPDDPLDGVRYVSFGPLTKYSGTAPQQIKIDGNAATATTPAYPVYKQSASGYNKPCFTGVSLPPTNQGYGSLARFDQWNHPCSGAALMDFSGGNSLDW